MTRNRGECGCVSCECSFEGTQPAAIPICDGMPWNVTNQFFCILTNPVSRMVANGKSGFQATISSLCGPCVGASVVSVVCGEQESSRKD